jgi:hypothetical protein
MDYVVADVGRLASASEELSAAAASMLQRSVSLPVS